MQKEIIRKEDKIIYSARFENLSDLYMYLKSNPEINRKVFECPASLTEESEFRGESLEKAIEYLFGGYKEEDLEQFLLVNEELQTTIYDEYSGSCKLERSMYTGMPLASLVAMGVPDCRIRYVEEKDIPVRNIYFNLGYLGRTNDEQILNRGLATLYLVQALEAKGDIVNFVAFSISKVENEIVKLEFNLKKAGDLSLDIRKCYFPMVAKEFLRRIIFRIMESLPVEIWDWGEGYGEPAKVKEVQDLYNVSDNDIVITDPKQLGIVGFNIYDDTISMIKSLGLEDEFNIAKIEEIKKQKKLTRNSGIYGIK